MTAPQAPYYPGLHRLNATTTLQEQRTCRVSPTPSVRPSPSRPRYVCEISMLPVSSFAVACTYFGRRTCFLDSTARERHLQDNRLSTTSAAVAHLSVARMECSCEVCSCLLVSECSAPATRTCHPHRALLPAAVVAFQCNLLLLDGCSEKISEDIDKLHQNAPRVPITADGGIDCAEEEDWRKPKQQACRVRCRRDQPEQCSE
jgi:hypothetical protein